MKSYKDLIVWQKSIELVIVIYRLTSKFPKSELFNMVVQMNKAAISIPSCIAEGFGRRSKKEKEEFYLVSYGSAMELENQIFIAKKLGFIEESDCVKVDELLNEILRMLNKLTSSSRANY